MKRKPHCYLRLHRRRSGLTGEEMAFLLGMKSGTAVSRFEQCKRLPDLRTALAYEVIFGVPATELYLRLYAEVEEDVIRRAYELHEKLQGRRGKTTRAKLDLLDDMLARATKRGTNQAI